MINRREALKRMGILLAGSVTGSNLMADLHEADKNPGKDFLIPPDPAHNGSGTAETQPADPAGLSVRFLGTGAADWRGPNAAGELRRFSSILVENHILIDFTEKNKEMLLPQNTPDTIFYTHSHSDHYNPEAVLSLGTVRQVYVGNTWYDTAKKEFSLAARKLNVRVPEITPVFVGQTVTAGNLKFTPAPANHATEKLFEQCLIYLVEKEDVRLLYATDTGGLTAIAARVTGIDSHQKGKAITALIMEATMGVKHHIDYRIFSHSSVGDVDRTVKVLKASRRYTAPEGQPVYITHMAKGLHGTMKEVEATLPSPLKAAYDGLEVTFRPPEK